MDVSIRENIHQIAADHNDHWAVYRLRLNAIRIGNHQAAGLSEDDIVEVEEMESPWINGSWKGQIVTLYKKGDSYIRPYSAGCNYRVRPSPEYLAKGLYLTSTDKLILLQPALNKSARQIKHFKMVMDPQSKLDSRKPSNAPWNNVDENSDC